MAGLVYTVTLDDKQLRLGTKGLLQAATHLRPIMVIAGGIFENSTRARFDGEYGPGRIPWPPTWKQRVGAVPASGKGRRKKMGPVKSGKSLQDQGNLRGSITSNVGDNFVETGPDGRSLTSRLAHVHQSGMTIKPKGGSSSEFIGPSRGGRSLGRGEQGPVRDHAVARRGLAFTGPDGLFYMVQSVTIPARPFMGVDAEDMDDLGEAFVDYLEGAASGY